MSDDRFVELVDDALLQEAVAERSRSRLLAAAEQDDATLAGSLRASGERGAVVVLRLTAGHDLRGRVVGLADDHLCLRGARETAWVALDAVVSVRPQPGTEVRPAEDASTRGRAGGLLVDVLRELAERGARVRLLLLGDAAVTGRLLAVGRDVAGIAADTGEGRLLVATAHVVAVTTEDTRDGPP